MIKLEGLEDDIKLICPNRNILTWLDLYEIMIQNKWRYIHISDCGTMAYEALPDSPVKYSIGIVAVFANKPLPDWANQ